MPDVWLNLIQGLQNIRNDSVTRTLTLGIMMFLVIGGITALSHIYTLNGIKSRTVGDGQHGTAR